MVTIDFLVKQILQQLPKMNADIVMELIQRKKEKIGAGYLTDQGALYLVASDLGITLSDKPAKPKERPIDQIKIPQITKEDVDKKARTLSSDKKRHRILSDLFSPMIMIGLMGAVSLMGNVDDMNSIGFYLGITAVIGGIIGVILTIVIPTRELETKERTFLEFYNAYKITSEYKYRDSNIHTKKYEKAVEKLSDFVLRWTRDTAPSAISELPDSISNNLKKKIIPLFKNNKQDRIQYFVLLLEKIVMFTYEKEPTAELLRAFNDEFVEFVEETKQKEERSVINTILKLIWIAPIAGIVIYLVFSNIWPDKSFESAALALGSSVTIMLAIVQLIRKK